MKPRILFIVPSDYEDLRVKGVAPLITERDEGGFFERVVTVHPSARATRVIDLAPHQRLYEYREWFLPFGERLKPLRYAHHFIHMLRMTWVIWRLLRTERIDLIRANDPAFTGLLAYLVTRLKTLPFCVSLHADYEKRFELDASRGAPTFLNSRRIGRRIEGYVLRQAQLVLPIRDTLIPYVVGLGVSPARVRVIPHGIDLHPFKAPSPLPVRERFGIPSGSAVLSFAGRLSRENYVHELLEVAKALKAKRDDVVLVMAGEGGERRALETAIVDHGLQKTVYLVGPQSRDIVIALRQQSAVSLCLMAGYSLIEACAAGRPVIAYDVEWHAELVKNGETGFLIQEHDVAGVAHAVLHLLDHPDEATRLGLQAQQLAFTRHDLQNTFAQKRRCYQELLAQGREVA